jgi:hypothetical protein
MTEKTKPVRLGDLLAEAGLMPSDYITTTSRTFEERGLPLGKALVLSGHLTDQQMRLALDVQSLVNEDLMTYKQAIDVLTLACREGISLAEAFKRSGFIEPTDIQTNRLGQLLLDAGVVTQKELDDCLQTNIRTALPLGHIIPARGFASHALVSTALAAQQFIRDMTLDRPTAIRAIKAAHDRELKLGHNSSNQSVPRPAVKRSLMIGELLTSAGIISEQQLLEALHRSLLRGRFVGETLVESGFVDAQLLRAVIDLQEMLDNRTFKPSWAVETILLMLNKKCSLAKAVAELGMNKIRQNKSVALIEVLVVSDLLRFSEIPGEATQLLKDDDNNRALDIAKILVAQELVSENAMISALRCVYLMDENVLDLEQTIMAIDLALRKKVTIDQAIHEFGWMSCTRIHDS